MAILFRGINPAIFTAYDENGNVSQKRTAKLTRRLLDDGVAGFFVCGSTGEGLLMNAAERKAVSEAVVGEVAGQVPVMLHIGALSTRETIELAKHAAKIGASAVSSIPPIFFGYDWEEVIGFYRDLAAASELPVYIYYIPQLTGSRIAPERLVSDLASIPGIVGMKFSAPQLYDLSRIHLMAGPQFNLLSGPDELMVPAAMLGTHGAVGTSYNMAPKPFLEAYQAIKAGDWAKAITIQEKMNRFIELYHRYGNGLGKGILRLQGMECGEPRPPMQPLTAAQMLSLQKDLEELDFFAWAR